MFWIGKYPIWGGYLSMFTYLRCFTNSRVTPTTELNQKFKFISKNKSGNKRLWVPCAYLWAKHVWLSFIYWCSVLGPLAAQHCPGVCVELSCAFLDLSFLFYNTEIISDLTTSQDYYEDQIRDRSASMLNGNVKVSVLRSYEEMVLAFAFPHSSWEDKKCTWEGKLQHQMVCAKWWKVRMHNTLEKNPQM